MNSPHDSEPDPASLDPATGADRPGDDAGVQASPYDAVDEPAASPEIAAAAELLGAVRTEIRRAVIGQEQVVDEVLLGLVAGGHVLLEGVPGLGKTLLVLALARTFGGSFARVQFTPDLMPSDVTGHAMFDASTNQFTVRRGPAFTNLLLADEINRAPAKTQSALLEVMQERQITIEGDAHALSPPFMVLATQNPIEQEGTYLLPEAQLDRFLLKIRIDYPSAEEEVALVAHVTRDGGSDALIVDEVQTVASPEAIVRAQAAAGEVLAVDSIHAYAVRIVRATRSWPGISIGAGPRGAIALVRLARAQALLAGRAFATPEDIKHVAPAALRHRIFLAPELELEGQTPDAVLAHILAETEAPRA